LAVVYIGLEDYDLALVNLEKAYEIREFQLVSLKVNPIVDPIRQDPRYKALLKKMNLD
jgi:hypothetical protein